MIYTSGFVQLKQIDYCRLNQICINKIILWAWARLYFKKE